MPDYKRQPRAGTGAGGVSVGPTDNQSTVILPQRGTPGKSNSSNFTDISALRSVWRTLSAEEASLSLGCRQGIARRRQEILEAFPAWRIPEIIDALNGPGPEGVAL